MNESIGIPNYTDTVIILVTAATEIKTQSALKLPNRSKLYVPTVSADHISRGRLIGIMDKTLEVPLTLVSAPAGYGKSALVSEWLRLREHPAVWLSLDEADSNLRQFISDLTAALEITCPGACSAVVEPSKAPELPPLSDLATYLVNDLDEIEGPYVVVLERVANKGHYIAFLPIELLIIRGELSQTLLFCLNFVTDAMAGGKRTTTGAEVLHAVAARSRQAGVTV